MASYREHPNPEGELALRIDELSPHQRALSAVLRFWAVVSVPASIVVALVVATALAWTRPGAINPGILLGVYFLVGMPLALITAGGQGMLRKRLAIWALDGLDEPIRGAITGVESSAGVSGASGAPPAQLGAGDVRSAAQVDTDDDDA